MIARCFIFAALILCGCTAPTTPVAERTARQSNSLRWAPQQPADLPAAVNPDKAMRWRRLQWQNENGEIPEDGLRRAITHRQENVDHWAALALRDTAGISPIDWVERGPINVGGRTRSLLIDPDDPNRLWAGAVSGGIWHSSDGGATWAPVNDWLSNLAICCLAMDPANPDVMYAGTGEGFFNYDGIGGAGTYKSVDGGVTWTQLASTATWDNVCRIAISPDDSNVILVAKRYGGVLRSVNGGATWTTRHWAQGSFFVAFDPTDGTKAVAQVIDYDFNTNEWFHAALYSIDGGVTWTPAGGALGRVNGFDARIELAYAPGSPNIVYASCAADGGKIWKSIDGGQSYVQQTGSATSGVNWYANPLWVDPTNPDFLVTGGYDFYKSTNGGVSLTRISSGYILTQQPHPDCHFVVADPNFDGVTNRRVYVCTDGGVWRTNNIYTASTFGSGGWTNLDASYRSTQFYGAAGDGPSGLILGGTQDNGTLQLVTGSDAANLTFGGDGGFCAIDPTDPSFCYGEYISLYLHRSTNGGVSADWIYGGITDAGSAANFIAPFVLDLNNPNTLLGGGQSLWRSTNVKAPTPSWQAIRPPGSDNISAIAVAPGNSDVIWVGQNNGVIERTANGTAGAPSWTIVDNNGGTNPLPNRYVTRIVVDADDAGVVYVSFGGFAGDNLWRTADAGATWADITGAGVTGLPDAPIRGIARHPNNSDWLYVGTEVGVFASSDGGVTWSTSNEGPANASVDELTFMHNSTTLLAATHGRGIFTAAVRDTALGDFDGDGDVDLSDFAVFAQCFGGSLNPPAAGCPAGVNADLDGDGDVDTADFSVLAQNFTGSL